MEVFQTDRLNSAVKRAELYLFLSTALMNEPKLNTIINVIPIELESLLKTFIPHEPVVHEFVKFMEDWSLNTKLRMKVRKDYDTFFVHPGGYRISLCESDYQSAEKNYDLEIRKLREIVDLNNQGIMLPFDHLSIILRTMQEFILSEVRAYQMEDAPQSQQMIHLEGIILVKHLIPWLFQWKKTIENKGLTNYYPLISALLCAFVQEDYEYVQSLLRLAY